MNRYTNIVLTVIAVSLVALVFENATPLARADSGLMRVALCDPIIIDRCASVGIKSDGTDTLSPLVIRQIK